MPSTVEIGTTRNGVTELTRHWEAENPWASLLLVHGLAEHSGRHEAAGQAFAEAGIDTRAFDLVGFGASGGHRAYVDSWSTYLDQVMDNLAPAFNSGLPTVLMGQSMGGLIAVTYTLSLHRQPDLVVLSAPALEGEAPGWQRFLAPYLSKVLPKLHIPNPIKGEQLCRDPEVGEAYFSDPLVFAKTSTKLGAMLFEQFDGLENVRDVYTARTLVIHGSDDTLVPSVVSEPLADVASVDRIVYSGLRHECMNEPEGPEVIADIIDWIRKEVEG